MATYLEAVVGNTAPEYQWVLKRKDNSIVDLTNTTVTIKWFKGKIQQNTTSGHDSCRIVGDPLLGIIGWTPKVGDLLIKAKLKGDVKVTYSDATLETMRNNALLDVRKLLGT